MKKKIMMVLLTLAVSFGAAAEGANVGAAWSIDPIGSVYNSWAVEFKIPSIPLQWGVTFSLGSQASSLAVTGDYWILNNPIASIVGYYVGVGGFVGLSIVGDKATVFPGVRVPFGLQIIPIKPLEFFIELAPAAGLVIADPITPRFVLQAALGFRVWF